MDIFRLACLDMTDRPFTVPVCCNEISEAIRQTFGVDRRWAFGIIHEAGWSDVDGNDHVNNLTFLEWC